MKYTVTVVAVLKSKVGNGKTYSKDFLFDFVPTAGIELYIDEFAPDLKVEKVTYSPGSGEIEAHISELFDDDENRDAVGARLLEHGWDGGVPEWSA